MKLKYVFLYLVVILGTSCSSPKALYSWDNYNTSAYNYMKTPTEESELSLIATYDEVISKQKGTRGVVPPGIYAEKGYLLLKMDKIEEGLICLKKEVELYPESEKFLSRIIKQYEE